MAYTPKFQDPRVQKRIRRALGFAIGAISVTKPQAWSTRYIDQWFGVQSNSLSAYLREQLLICVDDRWNKDTGECKKYLLNSQGVNFLSESIGLTTHTTNPIVLEVAHEEYSKELSTGQFNYKDKSQRLWHPIQNYRREYKRQILENANMCYHYDIECCAFSLILQYSQQLGQDQYPFAIRNYIKNRSEIRQELARELDIDPVAVKRILSALLAGAPLSTNPTHAIYQMLDCDSSRVLFLREHEFITNLRDEIKLCWESIGPTLTRREIITKTQKRRRLPISAKQKWGVYFDLERRVLNEIRSYLTTNNNKHFLEHDGWSCEREVNVSELIDFIKKQTGFELEIDLK